MYLNIKTMALGLDIGDNRMVMLCIYRRDSGTLEKVSSVQQFTLTSFLKSDENATD